MFTLAITLVINKKNIIIIKVIKKMWNNLIMAIKWKKKLNQKRNNINNNKNNIQQ